MDSTKLRTEWFEKVQEAKSFLEANEAVDFSTLNDKGQEDYTDREDRFDIAIALADKLKVSVERAEALEAHIDFSEGISKADGTTHPKAESESKTSENEVNDAMMKAFSGFLSGGFGDAKYVSGIAELKVMQSGLDDQGGYLVAPQLFIEQLLQNVDDAVVMRQFGTVFQINGSESLGVPSLDTDVDDAEWTSELATGSQDDSIRFGTRELRPQPLAKRTKISKKLLRQSVIAPENLIRERLAYKFAITEERAFMTGDGSNQPLGVFTASAQGISTARDVTAASATVIAGDDLIDTKHFLKAQYWKNSRWLFHRDAIRDIRKLKDGNSNYIWQPGLSRDLPEIILDLPYEVSEYVPNTFTTGLYVGMLGDFKKYWIVDSLRLEIQRLDELYAEENSVGFIGRLEVDGMPVLEEAFARLILA